MVIMRNLLVLIICMTIFIPVGVFAFWKICINIEGQNTAVWVVDPDIMGVKDLKTEEFAFVSLDCPQNTPYEHPFSKCSNGCPLYPESSIKIPSGKDKICEGDTVFVYQKRCKITSMSKGKDR